MSSSTKASNRGNDANAVVFVSIVLDGVGVGDAPDADAYGDLGSDTLGHVCTRVQPKLPNLARLGLGLIRPLDGVEAVVHPSASFGKMIETAAGKDSTTGHWELAGVVVGEPFPTYPTGFPDDVLSAFCLEAGVSGVLGNRPESGTVIIEEFGEEHQQSRKPIIYTSGDSVFQIAAHVDTFSLVEQYRLCEIARNSVCVGMHAVGRVIARPFEGDPGAYRRLAHARRDFSLSPPAKTVQEVLQDAGVRTISVGKISSLFGDVGFDENIKTKGNTDGIQKTLDTIRRASASDLPTFIWTNLVDFDELYGHRNDPIGFARALEEFDASLPALIEALPEQGCLLLTADHGNDPTFPGTDHTREQVPVLFYRPSRPEGADLGMRASFADHAATIAHYFDAPWSGPGISFA